MLNGTKEYVKSVGNLGREIETIKENQMEVLELIKIQCTKLSKKNHWMSLRELR